MHARTLTAVLCAVMMAVCSPLAFDSQDADADDQGMEIWYCYSHNVQLTYAYDPTGLSIEWTIRDADGDVLEQTTGGTMVFDAGELDRIIVTQEVSNEAGDTDVKEIVVFVIPRNDDPIYISFMDGDALYHTYSIPSSRAVMVGNPFIVTPQDPYREGYVFTGWYLDEGCTRPLDVYAPVTDDMVVYAGWRSVGGGSSTVIINNIYTVTFDVDPGLVCQPDVPSGTSLTFSVGVREGFEVSGDIQVSSTAGTLTYSGSGEYVLSGIDRSIVVTVTGDVHQIPSGPTDPSDPSEPTDEGGSDGSSGSITVLWVVLIVVVVIAIAFVLYYRMRRDRA